MPQKTEKDLWIEMSISEILTQARFARIAYSHIDPKAANGNDALFSSIHSFLSHCAMISKMLMASYDTTQGESIGDILGVLPEALVHQRTFRNHLEHYDERLKRWIHQYGSNANIGIYNIGPRIAIQASNMVFVSHYDPNTRLFTFVNDDFNLSEMFYEVQRIEELIEGWSRDRER